MEKQRLEFVPLSEKNSCIFAGEHSGCRDKETISPEEMLEYQYITGLTDYFIMDDGPTPTNMGVIDSSSLLQTVRTNSEHLVMNMLNQAKVVGMGININYPGALQKYSLKSISIEGSEHNLILGYVKEEGKLLSANA